MRSSAKTPASDRRSRIFVVDDHPLVREWLVALLRNQEDMEVCGEAGDSASTLNAIRGSRPDVVVTDLSLDGNSGLELIKTMTVQHPEVKIIVLSMHEETQYAERAIRAGARGYVMKRESTERIVEAVRQVAKGKMYASETVMNKLAERLLSGAARSGSAVDRLSDREIEVFRLLGQGRKTREIAEQMRISMKAVQAYAARIKDKLGLANASELMREAVRWLEDQERG